MKNTRTPLLHILAAVLLLCLPLYGQAQQQLTVVNGYGSGSYPPGSTVHVWAGAEPADSVFYHWEGLPPGTDSSAADWHASFVMPAGAVTARAVYLHSPAWQYTLETLTLATGTSKRVFWHAPASPAGLVLLHHGTGGSADAWTPASVEGWQLARALAARGYAVVATECEERSTGIDADGNGKIRWDASPVNYSGNADMRNHAALIDTLVARGIISAQTPLYAVGMSNGGAYSLSVAAVLARRGYSFRACISYCADGIGALFSQSTVPSLWLMAARDTNDEVSNTEAAQNAATLSGRGICSAIQLHQPQPLHTGRIRRVGGLSAAQAEALQAEMRANGHLDAANIPVHTSAQVLVDVEGNPSAYPTLVSLTGSQQQEVGRQYDVCYADHQMYSDWSGRTLWFLGQLCAPVAAAASIPAAPALQLRLLPGNTIALTGTQAHTAHTYIYSVAGQQWPLPAQRMDTDSSILALPQLLPGIYWVVAYAPGCVPVRLAVQL